MTLTGKPIEGDCQCQECVKMGGGDCMKCQALTPEFTRLMQAIQSKVEDDSANMKNRLWNHENGTLKKCADAAIWAAQQWELKVKQLENKNKSLHIKIGELRQLIDELNHAFEGVVAQRDFLETKLADLKIKHPPLNDAAVAHTDKFLRHLSDLDGKIVRACK